MPTPAHRSPDPARDPVGAPPRSPLHQAVDLVGDRWTLLIVDALLAGPRRFAEIQDDVVGIAPNILTQRLRTLEQRGLVIARPYSAKPVRLTYELTASAAALAPTLRLLTAWGEEHGPDTATSAAPAEPGPVCPTCGSALPDDTHGTDLTWL